MAVRQRAAATKRRRRHVRFTRDVVILGVAVAWGTVDILWFGARAQVLGLVGSLLLSPLFLRIDEALREKRNGAPAQK